MKTIQEVLSLAAEYLQNKSLHNPKREAEDLLAALLKCKRLDLYLRFDQPLQENELVLMREWTKRRGLGEPLEYLTKEVEFFGVQLELSPAVLIPRQETEILASKIAEKVDSQKIKSLWDVCCGSGAIGLALKKKFPQVEVSLSDISKEALDVARRNAQKNSLNVNLLQGDLFAPFTDQKADLIVCNPPYISESEYLKLDPSVRHFEPKRALVGGEDGLEFYRSLATEAGGYLRPGGVLCLEIGHDQGEEVLKLFSLWKKKILEKDWSGKDRFVFCLENE